MRARGPRGLTPSPAPANISFPNGLDVPEAAMRLREYLRQDLVLTGFRAEGMESVISRISEHLEASAIVSSRDEVEAALLARERAHTTALGHGIAIPHATLPGLEHPSLLVALASEPIRFGPEESDPVRVFFVLLSPPGRENEHIKLLARICRLLRHPGFVEELQDAGSGEAAVAIIERVDQEHV